MPTPQYSAYPTRLMEDTPHGARIKVVGVGGAGNNAINRMISSGVQGVEFIALNTDIQALQACRAEVREQIGARLTNGLGGGSDPDVGRRAALDDSDIILEALDGADMVFVTAGLGGGTGTGAAPVVAALASEMGALTVAIVTRPFGFEGKRRMAIADWGIHHLLDYVDTLIVIPNEKLLSIAKDAPFFESFRIADDFLRDAVQGISDIITTPGVINRDFADVKTTMAGMGYSVMGTASRSGPTRAVDAVMEAMASPLLEAGAIDGARGILLNITGSSSLRLSEVNEASTLIQSIAHEDANILFGAVLDERLGDEVKITVIATGFRNDGRDRSARRARLTCEAEQERAAERQSIQTAGALPALIREENLQGVQENSLILPDEPRTPGDQQPMDEEEPPIGKANTHDPEPDQTSSKEPGPELHGVEEDWRGAIREIARLTEPDLEFSGLADDAGEDLTYPNDPKRPFQPNEVSNFGWSLEENFDDQDRATRSSVPVESIKAPATLQEAMGLLSPDEAAAPPLGVHSRQVAIAAYAMVSTIEPEPHRGAPATAFAKILEARRQSIENASNRSLLIDPDAQPVALDPNDGNEVAELYGRRDLQGASKQDDQHGQVVGPEERNIGDFHSVRQPAPLTSPARVASAPQKGIFDPPNSLLVRATTSGDTLTKDLPKPLPEFNRRLHRDNRSDTHRETSQATAERQIRVPSFASGVEDDSYTEEPDELDIPAFLRQGI